MTQPADKATPTRNPEGWSIVLENYYKRNRKEFDMSLRGMPRKEAVTTNPEKSTDT